MDTQIVDIVLRITHYPEEIEALEEILRDMEGIISVHFHHPQLILIGFNPNHLSSQAILETLKGYGVEAEWVVPDQL